MCLAEAPVRKTCGADLRSGVGVDRPVSLAPCPVEQVARFLCRKSEAREREVQMESVSERTEMVASRWSCTFREVLASRDGRARRAKAWDVAGRCA